MKELFSQENQIITIIIIAVLMLLLMSSALLLFFFLSRRKITLKEIEKKSLEIAHQKKIIQSTILTQEKERTRIAQDLHDDISSKLNIVYLNANLLQDGNLDKQETVLIHKNILEATDKTLKSAREIAHNLIPPILGKFGFKDAAEELCDSFNASRKVIVDYQFKYPKEYLNSESELHLFRITQELINNSIKHGKANKINLKIVVKEDVLFYNYIDNGIGFNASEIANKKGLGFTNIENRIDLLQGEFDVESAINNGFKISIKI